MKKKLILVLVAVAAIGLFFTGCQPEASGTENYNGTINITNTTGKTLYVSLTAVNPSLKDGNKIFDKAKKLKYDQRLAAGKTTSWNFDYSKFIDSDNNTLSVWVSENGNTHIFWYYDKFDFFLMNANLEIGFENNDYYIARNFSEYTDYVPLHSEAETPDKSITVTNNTDFDMVYGIIGYTDEKPTHNSIPAGLTNKKIVKPGKSVTLEYFKSDLDKYEWVGVNYWALNATADYNRTTYDFKSYNYLKLFYGTGYEEFSKMTVGCDKDGYYQITTE